MNKVLWPALAGSLMLAAVCGFSAEATSEQSCGKKSKQTVSEGKEPGGKASATGRIVGKEHFALRDNLRICLWEKYDADSLTTARQRGTVVLLVHGGTWSGRPDFDLQIRDYSLMDYLAKNACDVWAIDIHGYGHSDKTDKDWSDTSSAASDIGAAVDYIAQTRGVRKVSILGWSWGTLSGGLYATQHPEKVNRLILYGLIWKGNPQYRKLPVPSTQYRTNTPAAAASDFIDGQYEPDVVEKYVHEALAADPKSPSGVIVDLFRKLPILDPKRITVPTLIIRAEKDLAITEPEALEFFAELGTRHKSYAALPDGGHAIVLEKNHRMFQRMVLDYLR